MNSTTRSFLFAVSAILILAGSILYVSKPLIAPYLFAVGAAGYAISYLTISTKEMGFRKRRLHRYNILSGLLMIFASGLMFANRKEWVICLTIAALFQLYTVFVTPDKE